jgi:hypothetical protein
MQRMTFIVFVFLFPSWCFGQVDSSAVQSADTFLDGIKLGYTPEGKDMISKNAWFTDKQYPLCSEISTTADRMFSTDNPHIEGYQKLLQITQITETGNPKNKKYLLISYKDTVSGQWKIFDLRESTDTELEAFIACKDPDIQVIAGDEVLQSAQYNYFQCGYWSAMTGKLLKSEEAFQKALELNKQDSDKHISQSDLENYLKVIRKITGR